MSPRDILITIRPEFARRILDGTKRVEYRRRGPAQPVRRAWFVATGTGGQVAFLCDVEATFAGSPYPGGEPVKYLRQIDGLTDAERDAYLGDCDAWMALELGPPTRLDGLTLASLDLGRAPQSWRYLSEAEVARLEWAADFQSRVFGAVGRLEDEEAEK